MWIVMTGAGRAGTVEAHATMGWNETWDGVRIAWIGLEGEVEAGWRTIGTGAKLGTTSAMVAGAGNGGDTRSRPGRLGVAVVVELMSLLGRVVVRGSWGEEERPGRVVHDVGG